MAQLIEDDRDGHLYGKHVVAAIRKVRALGGRPEGSYDMREVMASFVTKLSFREMCVVLKEQRGWRQVRDFFAWMKLQVGRNDFLFILLSAFSMFGRMCRRIACWNHVCSFFPVINFCLRCMLRSTPILSHLV